MTVSAVLSQYANRLNFDGQFACRSGRSDTDPLLGAHDCAELRRHGWQALSSSHDCVVRKTVEGFGSKVFVVSLRSVGGAVVEGRGEVTLYSTSCAQTGPVCLDRAHLVEQLGLLLEATEALNVFGDELN